VIKGPKHPEDGAVFRGHEQVSRDTLEWDGATPTTVEQLVSKVTGVKHSGENTKLIFFKSPDVIQVDLTTSQDSRCRLLDQWRFQAWIWVPDPTDDENGLVSLKKDGKTPYIVRAIVRHAVGERNANSIRLFREDGVEQLPEGLAVNNPMPDWGFKLGDAVPPGEKLSIFYTYYPDIEHLPPPQECSENLQIPGSIRNPILNAFKAFEDAENPAAQQDPPRARDGQHVYVHPDRQERFEELGLYTPPQTNRGDQNTQGRREDDSSSAQSAQSHRPQGDEGFHGWPGEPHNAQAPVRGSSRGRGWSRGEFSSSRPSRGSSRRGRRH